MNDILSPIGQLGVFKPIEVEGCSLDERDGLYCEIVGASFWKSEEFGLGGELEVIFLGNREHLTIGLDEFALL